MIIKKMENFLNFIKKDKKNINNKELYFLKNKNKYTIISNNTLHNVAKLLRLNEEKDKNYFIINFSIDKSRKYIEILNINDYTIFIYEEEENKSTRLGESSYTYITKYEPRTLIDIYFDYQLEFEKKYGKKTAILMQVGGFFELYGVDNDKEKIGNAKAICDLINILLSRRDKSILENSRKNAQMAGFPTANLHKYVNVLIQNSYTVVVIEHVTSAPDPLREITHIYSPSTYIEDGGNNSDSNTFVSIYINENKGSYYVGLSAIDIYTGNSYVYHIQDINNDKKAIFEDIYRFIENFNPKELLFTSYHLTSISKDYIQSILSNGNRIVHNNYNLINNNEHYLKINYLNAFLEKIYKNHGLLSGIEYIHLEKYQDTIISFVTGIQWVYDHDPNIIEKIKVPQIYEYHKHLILYHNASYQLNLVPLHKDNTLNESKYKSLFDIINKTSTSMGRRKLKYDLLNPITNINELEASYDKIEKIQDYKAIENVLSLIIDIEKLHRKMCLKILHPQEFSSLFLTYGNVKDLSSMVNIKDYGLNEEFIKEFESYISYIEEYLNVIEMGKYNLNDISNSFFKAGKYNELDELQSKITEIENYMNKECALLNLEIKKYDKAAMSSEGVVKLEENNNGYYMSITKRRSELLSKEVASKYKIEKGLGSNVRVTNIIFEEKSELLQTYRTKIKEVVKNKYLEFMDYLTNNYGIVMEQIVQFVSQVDVIKSHKKCALLYGYNRPRIINSESSQSYIEAKGIRHPIIEIIEDTKAYVTNDVYIGNKCVGFLLYGVNGVGKSSLSKAIGINIIMAQMGMYVPSREFSYYPFTKIFTRINGDDNIFKGMSSFVVEMNELRSILKYSDNRSIVLGDEVCKGTEETSALSIVASTIQRFSEKNVNFVLATHFHKLYDLLMKRNLSNVSFKHLSIEIDKRNDMIIYGRKLMDGMGNTNYGLDIARFILEDENFMVNAKKVRDEILEIENQILIPEKSNYNKNVFVHECAICKATGIKTQLDTHHIIEQHEFNEYKILSNGIQKDAAHNLVVLCKNHHDEVHNGNLRIYGYKDGPSGRILNYEYVTSKESEKILEELVDDSSLQSRCYSLDSSNPNRVEGEETETETETKSVSSSSSEESIKKKSNKKYNKEVVKRVVQLAKEFEDQLNQIKIIQSMINKEHQVVISPAIIKKMISQTY